MIPSVESDWLRVQSIRLGACAVNQTGYVCSQFYEKLLCEENSNCLSFHTVGYTFHLEFVFGINEANFVVLAKRKACVVMEGRK
jgi:hypothetical protein